MNRWARTVIRKVVGNKIISSTTISPSLVQKQITDDDILLILEKVISTISMNEMLLAFWFIQTKKLGFLRKKVDKANGPMHMLFLSLPHCHYH
jgi:hypothetical protein